LQVEQARFQGLQEGLAADAGFAVEEHTPPIDAGDAGAVVGWYCR
jgi:hypothetical protein